jgi:hypothetical protein
MAVNSGRFSFAQSTNAVESLPPLKQTMCFNFSPPSTSLVSGQRGTPARQPLIDELFLNGLYLFLYVIYKGHFSPPGTIERKNSNMSLCSGHSLV